MHALELRRLRDALPDVLATDIPTPAARERCQRQRGVTVTAEATTVEVGHWWECVSGGGHFERACPYSYISEKQVTGSKHLWLSSSRHRAVCLSKALLLHLSSHALDAEQMQVPVG